MSEHSQEHSSNNSHGMREFVILLVILGSLVVLVVRPFGYKMFQIDLQQHDILPVILILGIVGVIVVILQRQGIIFADSIIPKN
ncbi:MAG: hypothetical protein ACREBB_07920 [Nitrosotalea sp.]